MEILHTTSRKRETYKVELECSLLWESALSIAAVTNSQLIDTLDSSATYWDKHLDQASDTLKKELEYVQKNNTWKTLFQLLHKKPFRDLKEFVDFIAELSDSELKFISIPFTGEDMQEVRRAAANGDKGAVQELMDYTKENPFFPQYISFIATVESATLKGHLISVMTCWYSEVTEKEAERLQSILEYDYQAKREMLEKLSPEEFVQWATGGITYLPEPSVHHVLLIPQFSYRPWNIVADIEGTKVYYYPVANESVHPEDRYTPDQFLVLKYKALGDEVRLKMIKMLYEKAQTLQELTDQLEIGKSTIHHHLKILRAARLVEMTESKYTVKPDMLNWMPAELERFLTK